MKSTIHMQLNGLVALQPDAANVGAMSCNQKDDLDSIIDKHKE